MKHCDNCNEAIDTTEVTCPVCGKDMLGVQENDLATEDIVSLMAITGIL